MSEATTARILGDIAIARSGDKGDTATLSIVALNPADFQGLRTWLTAERVAEVYAGIVKGEVTRYELPQLAALHFVMRSALGGGVTRSLALDAHGKTLSSLVLALALPESTPGAP
jgi:hypothetical protein